MKTSTGFDIALIKDATSEKMLKPLALFYLIKAKFNHSIIYNYTPNKLSKLTGLHPKTITRYVNKLINCGLCVLRDGNLLFVKTKGIKKYVETRPYTSYKGILRRIYFIYLMNNKSQQKYQLARRYGIKIEALSPKARRKALKGIKLEKIGLESSIKPIMSITGASKLFNVSKNTAFNILKDLKDNNFIKTKPHTRVISKAKPLKYNTLKGYFFNKNGYLIQYFGSEILNGRYLTI